MKKIIFLIFLILTGITMVVAQDKITLRSGGELKARIIGLNEKDVALIPENSSDTIYLQRDSITKMQYQSGILIYLSKNEIPVSYATNLNPGVDSLYQIGERDATRFYKGYTTASTGTLLCSLFFPWGLVPAIACSATPPSINSLGYREQKLMENSDYFNGYTKQAYKIKKKKVWQGFAIGSGITVGFYIVLIAIVVNSY